MRSIGLLLLSFTLVAARVHAAEPVRAARPGLPLPGLSDAELLEYKEGFAAFRAHLFSQQGLGPTFNGGNRCYHCHRGPALGGQSKRTVTRFGRIDGGVFDPLASLGGSLLQEKAIKPSCAEFVPVSANVVIQRNATSTLGAGLVEAIPDQQIIDRAAAEQAENPAMAGRVHMVTGVSDGLSHVGRFGWKAQRALIVDVAAEAMQNEMGFTNALFPTENAPNGDFALLAECDSVPDPEDTEDFLGKVTRLLRFLSPMPPPKRMGDVMVQGEGLFHSIGCGFCHYTGYTAVSSIPAIDGKLVDLYSDLLLHDIGTGDGIVQGDAQGNEFRAAPLWVVRSGAPYLHDGRARTLAQAIDAHQGQALDARNAYFSLSHSEQNAVQKFLKAR
jgi:CxxC motif-containing protein (DUF1111 family)